MLRIKLLRISLTLSQWEVSRASGMSQGRYSMIERGLIEPNVEERDRLAAVFGTVPSTLLRAALRPSVDIADHRVSKIAAMPTGNFKR